ncbi:hypothetical protein SASPL_137022 [Salvia splendens]|uniref:Alpha-amylase/branching enzyme C-terminal all beta domain-containing protein n=1 Tax=Salvia splendens TaxID=180675 RepID=A0A8X8ZCK1_SALSN|nr:hypothetical protein SASPL_137022 [Salvia splendens]
MQFLNAFDRVMNLLDKKFKFLASPKQFVSSTDDGCRIFLASSTKNISNLMACLLQVIVFERGDLVFVFNFHPENTYEGRVCSFIMQSNCLSLAISVEYNLVVIIVVYLIHISCAGIKLTVMLGILVDTETQSSLVAHDSDHFTSPEGVPGVPETNFNIIRPDCSKVYYRVEEEVKESKIDGYEASLAKLPNKEVSQGGDEDSNGWC